MSSENEQSSNEAQVSEDQSKAQDTGERKYSQAEVDALLKAKHDSTYAQARRDLKPKREDAPQSKKSTNEQGGDADRFARILAQRDALDDALAGKQVTAVQRTELRKLLEKVDPDEPSAWLEAFAGSFLGGGAKPEATTPSNDKPTMPQRRPDDHPGPAQSAPPWERPSDPFSWTAEDVARLEALKGKREAHRIIRQKAEAYARTMRIAMAPDKRR